MGAGKLHTMTGPTMPLHTSHKVFGALLDIGRWFGSLKRVGSLALYLVYLTPGGRTADDRLPHFILSWSDILLTSTLLELHQLPNSEDLSQLSEEAPLRGP